MTEVHVSHEFQLNRHDSVVPISTVRPDIETEKNSHIREGGCYVLVETPFLCDAIIDFAPEDSSHRTSDRAGKEDYASKAHSTRIGWIHEDRHLFGKLGAVSLASEDCVHTRLCDKAPMLSVSWGSLHDILRQVSSIAVAPHYEGVRACLLSGGGCVGGV